MKLLVRKNFLKTAFWFVVAILGLWTLLRLFIPEDRWFWLLWGTYLLPWILMFEIVLLIFACWRRWWGIAISLSVLVMPWIIVFFGNFFITKSSAAIAEEDRFSVMSYSVRGPRSDPETLSNIILENNADIVVMQEVHQVDKLKQRLKDLYAPKSTYFCAWEGGMVVSRFKLDLLKKPVCLVDHPKGKLHLWNVHFDKAYFNNHAQLANLKRMEGEYKRYPGARLIVGDINTTVFTQVHRKLIEKHRDALLIGGCPFAFTFPTPVRKFHFGLPVLGIDKLFYSQEFDVQDCEILKVYGKADHYPFRVNLYWNNRR